MHVRTPMSSIIIGFLKRNRIFPGFTIELMATQEDYGAQKIMSGVISEKAESTIGIAPSLFPLPAEKVEQPFRQKVSAYEGMRQLQQVWPYVRHGRMNVKIFYQPGCFCLLLVTASVHSQP